MLDRILVPLDGSATAQAILPHLRRLLRRRDSEVLLLSVAPPPIAEAQISVMEASLAASREYILGIKETLERQGVRVRAEARMGPPASVILDMAEEEEVSLIALATHGRTGLKRALLGSVAEQILRKSRVPVFVVRPFWSYEVLPPKTALDQPFTSILVPTDQSDSSLAVLTPAAELADLFGARLVLLHVLEEAKRGKAGGGRGEESVARAALEAVAKSMKAKETAIVVHRGDPSSAILETARASRCDLIAMATHGRSGISRLVVGSVTEKVLREAKVPLLIVKATATPVKAGKRAAKPVGKEMR
jgi:nucleotide-binding universal stress UspA family protein